MRSKGTATELERRRRWAISKWREGWTQKDIADFLDVTDRSVRRWVKCYCGRGIRGLAATPHPPCESRLTAVQQKTVLGWLKHSPADFGFLGETWTARRLAQVIHRTFEVRYNHRYLNAWLSQRGITPQKPQRLARQRDERRIRRWVRDDWPRILKKGPKRTPISF